jgi:hypothetical protein
VGNEVYVQSARYGQLVRKYSPPRNPKTERQQATRQGFGALSSQWHALPPEAQLAWCAAAIRDRTGLSGYHYFMKLNPGRIHIGLARLDYPPSQRPGFDVSSVGELVVVMVDGKPRIKLHVPNPPGQYTLVAGAASVSAGVRCVQHYCYLGLLPPPQDGWSDITDLYVARYGEPIRGQVVFIRTRQQIDGWMDEPKVTSVLVPRV